LLKQNRLGKEIETFLHCLKNKYLKANIRKGLKIGYPQRTDGSPVKGKKSPKSKVGGGKGQKGGGEGNEP